MRGILRKSRGDVAAQALLPAVLALVVLLMVYVDPRFFSRLNLLNLSRNFSIASTIALAQSMVMIVGGFDLSVGAVTALASVLGATTMLNVASAFSDALWLAVLAGVSASLVSGLVVGAINGAIVATMQVSAFIVTLGISSVVLGIVFYVTKGVPVYGIPDLFVRGFGRQIFVGAPLIFWVGLLIIAVLWIVMNRTPAGRHIYAVGGAPRAAHASGIAARRVTIGAFALASCLAAIGGLMITARIGSGQSTIGTSAAIESIAAAVIGGVSLRGGKGSVLRVALGALFLTIVANALNLAHVDSKFQTLVLGVFIIGAIALERAVDRSGADD